MSSLPIAHARQTLTSSLQAPCFWVPDITVGFQLLQGPYEVPAFLHSYGPGNSTHCPLEVTLMFCLKSLSGISAGAGTVLQCSGYTKEFCPLNYFGCLDTTSMTTVMTLDRYLYLKDHTISYV